MVGGWRFESPVDEGEWVFGPWVDPGVCRKEVTPRRFRSVVVTNLVPVGPGRAAFQGSVCIEVLVGIALEFFLALRAADVVPLPADGRGLVPVPDRVFEDWAATVFRRVGNAFCGRCHQPDKDES